MVLFEGRSSRGGYGTSKSATKKREMPTAPQAGKPKNPKKTKAKPDNSTMGQAEKFADMLYEFVIYRLPPFKLVHNKRTGKSEKVPIPVSRKRMIGDFKAMLESGEYNEETVALVLNCYISNPGTWEIRSVTSFWKNFSILLEKYSRTWHPYTDNSISSIVEYLHNRFILDYDTLESVVGRSLFALEQVLDAMADAGLEQELTYLRNVFGSAEEWVQGHLASVGDSKLDIEYLALTVVRIKKQIVSEMARYGKSADWVDRLEVSMERTAKRIREERS
jgi:hypothetical protein